MTQHFTSGKKPYGTHRRLPGTSLRMPIETSFTVAKT